MDGYLVSELSETLHFVICCVGNKLAVLYLSVASISVSIAVTVLHQSIPPSMVTVNNRNIGPRSLLACVLHNNSDHNYNNHKTVMTRDTKFYCRVS